MFKLNKIHFTLLLSICSFGLVAQERKIQPTWESLAQNYQVPEWFLDGKIGVWMHWGIPSSIKGDRPHDGSHYGRWVYGTEDYIPKVPSEAVRKAVTKLKAWHIENYGPLEYFGYEDLIPQFKGENFDAEAIVKFVKECGARFIMPVATHHDNFDMYDSSFPYNSVKMGPKRDVLQEWKNAAYNNGLKFGVSTHLYWSPRFFNGARKYQKPNTPEWKLFNMDYDPVRFASQDSWNKHWYQRCWDVIEKYNPDMFNNDSPYPDLKTGKGIGLKLFTDYLNKDLKENNGKQTTVLSFKDAKKNKAAFTYNMERGMSGEIQEHPWMWATDISGTWFYRKGASNRILPSVLIGNAIDAISKNGVVMINIAQKGDGTIPENQIKILSDFGTFVKTNQEGIYRTRPWKIFGEGSLKIETRRGGENLKEFSEKDIRFTQKGNYLFVFVLAQPTQDITIESLKKGGLLKEAILNITLLGSTEKIKWQHNKQALSIQLPKEAMPNPHAICFKLYLQ
ncbi:alpha-L-fucosidase [Flavicella sediminum]|uniref:alpha-L-fucosidase n=1 Tax=Flavicella sediminum TaxID=2585141 RepID=UPI001120C3AC|nr:alpha-L-fucosidase [Flavicella sediminum]